MDPNILLEALKYVGIPALLAAGWKRWVRIRVTTHLGCIYERRRSSLQEAMDAGADPGAIFVRPAKPPEQVTASAMGPEHLPPDTAYREALFIRVINRSERVITVSRVWVETPSGEITVNVPGGQQVVEKDHVWETWVLLGEVRRKIANAEDYYTSVRIRVLQSRRRTWRSVKADDSEVGVSGDVAISARRT